MDVETFQHRSNNGDHNAGSDASCKNTSRVCICSQYAKFVLGHLCAPKPYIF